MKRNFPHLKFLSKICILLKNIYIILLCCVIPILALLHILIHFVRNFGFFFLIFKLCILLGCSAPYRTEVHNSEYQCEWHLEITESCNMQKDAHSYTLPCLDITSSFSEVESQAIAAA